MTFQSKKAKTLAGTIDREKLHGVDEAISIIKANATSKFDETIEVAIALGVDPRESAGIEEAEYACLRIGSATIRRHG